MRVHPTAAPVSGLLTLEEAKAHLGLTGDDEDTFVTGLISAVSTRLDGPDGTLSRSIQPWTYVLSLDCYPVRDARVRLPYGPVHAVSSVVSSDEDGTETDLAAARYRVRLYDEVSFLEPVGDGWPQDAEEVNVEITYLAWTGTGTVAVPVVAIPAPVKVAAGMILQSLFDHRDATPDVREVVRDNPMVERLLLPYRLTHVPGQGEE